MAQAPVLPATGDPRVRKLEAARTGAVGQEHSEHDFHERALSLHAHRLQVLASNIANADTPGYKARDVDVAQALREGIRKPADLALYYVTPSQPSIDGNTVDLDRERASFADAALRYQFCLDRVSGHYKHMMELFQNLKG